jgi:hypothetical protein
MKRIITITYSVKPYCSNVLHSKVPIGNLKGQTLDCRSVEIKEMLSNFPTQHFAFRIYHPKNKFAPSLTCRDVHFIIQLKGAGYKLSSGDYFMII